ncbi:MAG: alpha/beta fold hydrolase [Verrucomicrobiota bacterium]
MPSQAQSSCPSPVQWDERLLAVLTLPLFLLRAVQTKPCEGEAVVLLHGLSRNYFAMKPLAKRLHARGFHVVNISYPSHLADIPTLIGKYILPEIEKLGDRRIHFVTHSLGGILVRWLLKNEPPANPGRLVMLAPPNQGNEIVDRLGKKTWFPLLMGSAAMQLGTDGIPKKLGAVPIPACVVMGRRAVVPFFRGWHEGEGDGFVGVAGGHAPGVDASHVIEADHTFIMMHPEAIRIAIEFLESSAPKRSLQPSPAPEGIPQADFG